MTASEKRARSRATYQRWLANPGNREKARQYHRNYREVARAKRVRVRQSVVFAAVRERMILCNSAFFVRYG